MDKQSISSINKEVYRRFPEVKGKTPKVQTQKVPKALNSQRSETYLLIYSASVKAPGNKTMKRYVRVVANGKGKIIKISTSR